MTYFDQRILFSIRSEEFLGQAWMKEDKKDNAPNICLITERFNDMCRLIVSEIVTAPCMTSRVEIIEKWAAVADICRCLHNFNGVLQVCAAFTNSSVFRLKETGSESVKRPRVQSLNCKLLCRAMDVTVT